MINEKFRAYSEIESSELNEGFLDSILRFFKGLFDLFSSKKIKKESEEISSYLNKIQNDLQISDEELEEEIDPKRVRKISGRLIESSKRKIEVDTEKGVASLKSLVDSVSGWMGIVVVQEESLKMPFLEKILKNSEMKKRLVWVPYEWSSKESLKGWYSDKECVLDPKIATSLVKVLQSTDEKKKVAIKDFSSLYVNTVLSANFSEEKTKPSNETLKKLHLGFSTMFISLIETVNSIIKNTPDQKMSEVIAAEMVKERSKTDKKASKKETEDELVSSTERTRKKKKTETESKPTAEPKEYVSVEQIKTPEDEEKVETIINNTAGNKTLALFKKAKEIINSFKDKAKTEKSKNFLKILWKNVLLIAKKRDLSALNAAIDSMNKKLMTWLADGDPDLIPDFAKESFTYKAFHPLLESGKTVEQKQAAVLKMRLDREKYEEMYESLSLEESIILFRLLNEKVEDLF